MWAAAYVVPVLWTAVSSPYNLPVTLNAYALNTLKKKKAEKREKVNQHISKLTHSLEGFLKSHVKTHVQGNSKTILFKEKGLKHINNVFQHISIFTSLHYVKK